MCNCLHKDSEPLKKKKGIGYKAVVKYDGKYYPLVSFDPRIARPYRKKGDKIIWRNQIKKADGFCILPSLKEAKPFIKLWRRETASWSYKSIAKDIIVKVYFEEGVGRHMEDRIFDRMLNYPVDTILARKFQILEETNL